MAINFEDLPPRYQKQAEQKMAQQAKAKAPKYGNKKETRGNLKFDSAKEARHFDSLMLLLRAGAITELKVQPQFTLSEAYTTTEGVHVRAIRYVADFSYKNHNGELVVEDVKSPATKTRVYEIKRKLLRERFGIEIKEIL